MWSSTVAPNQMSMSFRTRQRSTGSRLSKLSTTTSIQKQLSTRPRKQGKPPNDLVSKTPYRSGPAHQANLGSCAQGEIHSTRAHLDASYLVGAESAGCPQGGSFGGALAWLCGPSVPAEVPGGCLSPDQRFRRQSCY